MKIVLSLFHFQHFRHFDSVVRKLCAEGNTVDVVADTFEVSSVTDRAVQRAEAEISGISFQKPLGRRDLWKYMIRPVRELLNYTLYFRPGHPSLGLATLWGKYFSKPSWSVLKHPGVARFLARDSIQAFLRRFEPMVPPSALVLRWLKETKPDLVVASPLVHGRSTELEYIKAANVLHIPTVYALASWDNLTTKGTIHVLPDLVFVWNQPLLEEAVALHRVPRERIVVTGAPTFDYWFQMKPSKSRAEFCRELGMEPHRQYVVYLCTSRGMIEDEESVVLDLAKRLRNNPVTTDLILLVRPHPYNELDLERMKAPNVRVYPEGGDWPDVDQAKQTYFDTLNYARATVGINTSAMIESAIVDIPCITIIDDRYRGWQTDMGHFWHLMKGDFLEVQYSFDAAVDAIAGVLKGQDVKCEQRRKFVRDFVRPNGIDRPVTDLFCTALTLAAQRKTAAQIMQAIGPAQG